ncbi:hypothetical protein [Mycobacterium florentinum]|uniref:hypothetical protein n=1 Tax=Mycobacterium florentinum TaxID=292462 RepID=UPI00138C48E0|nr:hypothetical protein [Mycobacterium florentinum]MCV7411141.1 hypothetical protein [Mycobacterium florentinum]BBX80489.1 hypothetical protein MFLOJ_42760 [Mycobacterium florentinum]
MRREIGVDALRPAGLFTLVDDNGWSRAKAEEWLRNAVGQALLKPRLLNPH